MSKLFIKLFHFLVILYSVSSTIYINITTKSTLDSFRLAINQNVSNINAEVKVNNKTIIPRFNGLYLDFKSEPGEIEVIIHTNLTSLKELFNYNTANTVKIKTSGTYVTDLEGLFNGQNYLRSIDLSEFDISKVTSFVNMFAMCFRLEEIKFGNYSTSSANNMNSMFYYCNDLSSIDLSIFDTS